METEFDKSNIERLKKRLYSNDFGNENHPRESMQDLYRPIRKVEQRITPDTLKNAWDTTPIQAHDEVPILAKGGHIFKIIFALSIVFCLGAASIAALYYFSDKIFISSENIDIIVQAPTTVAGGEVLPLSIGFANNNRVALGDVQLTVTYPDNSYDPVETTKVINQEQKDLGTVEAGASKQTTASALLLGEEGETKSIIVTAEYRVGNAGSVYTKEKQYDITISQSPLSLVAQYQKEINSGQEVTFEIEIAPNAGKSLEEVQVVAEYPFGFNFIKSFPVPSSDTNVWYLGGLTQGEKKKISVTGTFQAASLEQKTMRFAVGMRDPNDERKIATAYTTKSLPVTILRPFVSLDVQSGSTGSNGVIERDAVARLGQQVTVQIELINNVPSDLLDASVELTFVGGIYDPQSVNSLNGFYRPSTKTMTWDQGADPELKVIPSGESRRYGLGFNTYELERLSARIKNPQLTYDVVVRGTITNESGSKQQVEVRSTEVLKFITDIVAETRTYTSANNAGPIPPQVDKKTKYMVEWLLGNTTNHVSNLVVQATLPSYVSYVPSASSTDIGSGVGTVTYNDLNRTVTWRVGELQAYAGAAGMEIAPSRALFEVELFPSATQVGQELTIVNTGTAMQGVDRFTNSNVTVVVPQSTTRLYDPASNTNEWKVAP